MRGLGAVVTDSGQAERKTCFVAMPVTTPNTYTEKLRDENHFTHVLDHLFKPALEKAGYSVIPPSVLGAELIHAEIIKNLEQADLVLCDLSSLNPNVFFELGIRTSLDRPVAIVKDNLTSPIPFDLNAINTLTYDGSLTPWTLDKETERLVDHINNVANSTSNGNAMWRYFGLTKRASPSEAASNPIEAKVDLVLTELSRLQITQNTSPDDTSLGTTDNYQRMARALQVAIDPILRANGAGTWRSDFSARTRTLQIGTPSPVPKQAQYDIKKLAEAQGIIVSFEGGARPS
jgi:hypothetical protein